MSDSTPNKRGQFSTPRSRFPTPYVESEKDKVSAHALIGTSTAEVTPIDKDQCKVREFTAPTELYEAFSRIEADHIDLSRDLPDVLLSIGVTYNHNHGDGSAEDIGSGYSFGDTVSIDANLSAKASGSQAVQPDIQPQWRRKRLTRVAVNAYMFFLSGNPTQAAILTKLATIIGSPVLAWPIFNEEIHTITLGGGAVSHSVGSSFGLKESLTRQQNGSINLSIGKSNSDEVSLTTITKELPPCIHAAITINNPFTPPTVNVRAVTSFAGAGEFDGVRGNGRGGGGDDSADARPTITPSFLPATNPPAYPSTGLYFYEAKIDDQDDFGYSLVRAVVVDFATLV